jgi:arsenite-transporting ATPase
VCIPEFLSMYETERLTQELMTFNIDIRNIVINQVLMTNDVTCQMCNSRKKMQGKYISQIRDLFEDFHITILPQMCEEVRGVQNLSDFCKLLLNK